MAALTHIRSRAWLEQMVARATRVDPHGGPYAAQRATVFHPDDPLFARFRHSIETEQGMIAKRVKPPSQSSLADWLFDNSPQRMAQAKDRFTTQRRAAAARTLALLRALTTCSAMPRPPRHRRQGV